jgi:hypothetical protein
MNRKMFRKAAGKISRISTESKTFGLSTRLRSIKALRFPKHLTETDHEPWQPGIRLPRSRGKPVPMV